METITNAGGMNTAAIIIAVYLIITILTPIICVLVQGKMIKKKSKGALYFPIGVLACSIIFGLYTIVIAAILFIMYYIDDKNSKSKIDEIDKMNKQDLE